MLRRTDAAVQAIGYAERALGELSGMRVAMDALAQARAGRVRLAATAAVMQTLIPPALHGFASAHPQVQVAVDEVAPADFVETVLSGRVDFGVGTLETAVSGLREDILIREPLVAAAVASKHFTGGTPMSWKQLAAYPLITVRPGYGIRNRIEATAREAGARLRIVHEVSLLRTAVAFAAHGVGVVVAPLSLVADEPRLVMRKLVRPTVERITAVVSKRERSLEPAAQAFVDLLRQCAAASPKTSDALQPRRGAQ